MSSSSAEVAKAHVIGGYLQSLMMNSPDSEVELKENCFHQGNGDTKVQISAKDLYGAMKNCDLNPTLEDIEETISHVKREAKDEEDGQMNFDELVKIAKLLVVPRVVDQLAKACRVLEGDKKKKVVLYGESGVGKTWMLKKIAGHAIRKGDFDVAIWVYLNRIYEGLSLHESIAYQLSVLTDFEKFEAEEAKMEEDFEKTKAEEAKKEEDQLGEEEGEQKESEETKETKRRDKFERLIREKLKKKKKLLLVVDNEGSNWSEVDSTDGKKLLLHFKLNTIDLGEILALNMVEDFKVLISTRKEPTKPEQPGSEGIELMVRPLNWEESRSFVDQHIEGVVERDDLKKLADFFIGKSGRLPVEILIMARVLSFFGKNDLGMKKLREDKEKIEKVKGLQVVDVLIKGYTRIPKSVLMDCFSLETNHERHFLHRGGMVNFNELIVYWIIEGHLGQCGRVKDAYEEGHRVFMELMHCGLLDKQEGDYITPSGAKFSFGIHDWHEFYRKPRSGLGVTYDMKLGRVAWDEGLIKTVSNSFVQREREKKITTLMLDGNHFLTAKLPAENLFKSPFELETIAKKIELPNANTLFDSLTELENLAVFDPTGQHFSRPVEMKKLRFLVLRGCQYMEKMEPFFVWRNDHKNPQQKPLQRSQSLPTALPQMHSQNPNSPTSQSVSHAL